jgi:hypothetical protein
MGGGKMERWLLPLPLALIVSFIFLSQFSLAQEQARLVGDWQMVVEAEGQYYYLQLSFKETEGKLEGTVSEASGFFSHLPLTNIKLEADKLTFDFTAPTPPDGLARLISADLKIAPDYEKMEGTLTIPDLGITASATVTRKK